jgi:hypothetical protein
LSVLACEIPGRRETRRAEGRVVDAGSGDPLRKAMVFLRRNQQSGAAAYTDAKGEFHFSELEPGAYALSALHDGYVLGRKDPPIVVTILPEKTQSDLTVKLVRTGAVSGRVVDADGDPVAGASVQLLAAKAKWEGAFATTNDHGEYREYGIPPGKYRLVVASNSKLAGDLSVKLTGAEERNDSWTYYPGTADARRATTIEVSPGAELPGFDLALVRSRVVRVRGRIIAPADAPGPFLVMLNPITSERPGQGRRAQVRNAGGECELTGVEPGAYILNAMGAVEQDRYYARRAVNVGESDIGGNRTHARRAAEHNGTVIGPEGRPLPPGLVVALSPQERIVLPQGGLAPVARDGTFHSEPLAAGDYEVTTGRINESDDLYVSAIHMGDEDVPAKGLHLGDAASAPLEIVLASNGGALQATVANEKGDPIPQAHVILLPDPPRRAQRALGGDCTTEASGGCDIRGLAPGDYHALAFANHPPLDVDEATIKQFENNAKSVTIAPGEQARLRAGTGSRRRRVTNAAPAAGTPKVCVLYRPTSAFVWSGACTYWSSAAAH